MSRWADVGQWLKDNAASGAALVGSLLTGNVPAAVAAGVSLVASATGSDDPNKALQSLQRDPATVVKLQELANQAEASIREHIRAMTELQLQDQQAEHHETQETIRAGDRAEDKFVRWTRPGQSWLSLGLGAAYVFGTESPDVMIFGMFLTLPWAYAGLRQIGKGVDALAAIKGKK